MAAHNKILLVFLIHFNDEVISLAPPPEKSNLFELSFLSYWFYIMKG